jgi:2-keto-4-pentenoate hydratase
VLSAAEREQAAQALLAAARDHATIRRLGQLARRRGGGRLPISQLVAEAKLQAGRHPEGPQDRPHLAADAGGGADHEPDYGVLLDDLFVAEGSVIPTDRLFQPLAEAELAFVLRSRWPAHRPTRPT